MEPRKYGRDTPLSASRPISVFVREYGTRRKKIIETRAERDFVHPFSSLLCPASDGSANDEGGVLVSGRTKLVKSYKRNLIIYKY